MVKEAKSQPWTERAGTKHGDPEESVYPHNKKWVFSGGVELDVGNEPGKQYVKLHHPSGSYTTFWPDGKMETFVRGESRQYNKTGVTLTVDENNDVHIRGHNKIQMAGGAHVEVAGDAGIVCGGDVALAALDGSVGLQAKNMYLGMSGNMEVNVKGNVNFKVGGSESHEVSDDHSIEAGGDTSVKSSEHSVDAKQSWDGDVSHSGDYSQSGVHVDNNGPHTA